VGVTGNDVTNHSHSRSMAEEEEEEEKNLAV